MKLVEIQTETAAAILKHNARQKCWNPLLLDGGQKALDPLTIKDVDLLSPYMYKYMYIYTHTYILENLDADQPNNISSLSYIIQRPFRSIPQNQTLLDSVDQLTKMRMLKI